MTPKEKSIVREIISYFLRNPDAADTLEGIARWRLLDETVHRRVKETQAALQWLVAQGIIQEHVSSGGTIFGLNPESKEQAEQLLASEEDPAARGNKR
jgi:hypothetical protein